jgi:hypothetical protein
MVYSLERRGYAHGVAAMQKPVGYYTIFNTAVDYFFVQFKIFQFNGQHQAFAAHRFNSRVYQ